MHLKDAKIAGVKEKLKKEAVALGIIELRELRRLLLSKVAWNYLQILAVIIRKKLLTFSKSMLLNPVLLSMFIHSYFE